MSHRILCVGKSDHPDLHERITHIGGRNAGGSQWIITQQAAIEGIETERWAFFAVVAGRRIEVVVAVSAGGHKYLKLETDGEQVEDLLTLPGCG